MKYKLRGMRIPDSMWEKIREAARLDDRTMSGWLRDVVAKALRKIDTVKKQEATTEN